MILVDIFIIKTHLGTVYRYCNWIKHWIKKKNWKKNKKSMGSSLTVSLLTSYPWGTGFDCSWGNWACLSWKYRGIVFPKRSFGEFLDIELLCNKISHYKKNYPQQFFAKGHLPSKEKEIKKELKISVRMVRDPQEMGFVIIR